MARDDDYLFFLLDLVGDFGSEDLSDHNFRYAFDIRSENKRISVDVWNEEDVRFSDETDSERQIKTCAVQGDIIELGLSMDYLDKVDQVWIDVSTYYWNSDQDKGSYDYVEVLIAW